MKTERRLLVVLVLIIIWHLISYYCSTLPDRWFEPGNLIHLGLILMMYLHGLSMIFILVTLGVTVKKLSTIEHKKTIFTLFLISFVTFFLTLFPVYQNLVWN